MTNTQLAIREDMSLVELGTALAKSGYFKDVGSISQAIVKILAGRELGIPAIAAMTGIFIIEGKVSMSAGLMAAQVKRSEKYDYEVTHMGDDYVEIVFKQDEREIGRSCFTIDDAKRAGTKNMAKFPRNMLFARAMSNGVKWFTPDIFTGPVYTSEELGSANAPTEPPLNRIDAGNIIENAQAHRTAEVGQSLAPAAHTEQPGDVVDASYDEAQIGPDFDAPTTGQPRTDVDQATGEVKMPQAQQPKTDSGASVITPEFVEGALEYRKENGIKQVKWGDRWKPAEEPAKGLTDAQLETLLGMFKDPKTGKINTFEATAHLKKHHGAMNWRSLSWERVAATVMWKKHGIPDQRFYPEEYKVWLAKQPKEELEPELAGKDATRTDIPIDEVIPDARAELMHTYGITEQSGIDEKELAIFLDNLLKLDDPLVLLALLNRGLTAAANFDVFSQFAELLASKTVDLSTEAGRADFQLFVDSVGKKS